MQAADVDHNGRIEKGELVAHLKHEVESSFEGRLMRTEERARATAIKVMKAHKSQTIDRDSNFIPCSLADTMKVGHRVRVCGQG